VVMVVISASLHPDYLDLFLRVNNLGGVDGIHLVQVRYERNTETLNLIQ
jgi:hypothetical protein